MAAVDAIVARAAIRLMARVNFIFDSYQATG